MVVGWSSGDAVRGASAWRRLLVWAVLTALAALIVYTAFRGYLGAELLFDLASSFHC